MRRMLGVVVVLLLVGATAAHAEPQSTPNGPWMQPEQEMRLDRLHSYDELVDALRRIERSSQGNVRLEVVGQSNEGRDIYMAIAGNGPARVMYMTQQHGNEPLGTEAALQFLQYLGGSSSDARELRDAATLFLIVRVNPDGSERFWRQNYDPDASGPFHAPGRGFDINRYHDPNLHPDDNPVPEAAAVRRAHARYQPQIMVDYHHQGSYRSADGKSISMSVFWPNNPNVSQEVVDASQQVAIAAFDSVQRYGHGEVSRYPGGTIAGIGRNAYGLLGSASVLVEQRGGIGQKSSGMLMRQALVSMDAILRKAANGSLEDIDPARVAEIPPRGPSMSNPRSAGEAEEAEVE